jgi:hypothetical protein
MKNPTASILLTLLGAFSPGLATGHESDVLPAQTPGVAPAPVDHRDTIRAARDKFDRDLKLDTKRPWDGQDWGSGKFPKGKPSPALIEPKAIGPAPG